MPAIFALLSANLGGIAAIHVSDEVRPHTSDANCVDPVDRFFLSTWKVTVFLEAAAFGVAAVSEESGFSEATCAEPAEAGAAFRSAAGAGSILAISSVPAGLTAAAAAALHAATATQAFGVAAALAAAAAAALHAATQAFASPE